MSGVYDFTAQTMRGEELSLAQYRDQVLLIVNTASRCIYTNQYSGLQSLHDRYHPRGLEVLAFPCDQFGHQEPGDSAQIETFCTTNFAVKFPVFEKIEVNGPHAAPLFDYLKRAAPGLFGSRRIKWNFTKFLLSRDGARVQRFAPRTAPETLRPQIERLLAS